MTCIHLSPLHHNYMCARKSTINISEESEGFLFSETGFLSFTPDGKQLLAVSDSGLIYKYEYNASNGALTDMTELVNHQLGINEKIGMISVSNSGEVAITSSKNELVQFYSLNSETKKLEAPRLVTKCPGAIDALAINPSGTILCCSGKDNIVKVINIQDKTFPILNQIPSTHFVKAISFNSTGNFLALLQVDGMLKIFKIIENDPAPQLFKTFLGPKSDINGKFQISWKDNNLLSILYGSKILRIYETENWSIKSELYENEMQLAQLISTEVALIGKNEVISLYSIAKNQVFASTPCENIETSSIAAFNEASAFIFDPSKCDLFSIKFEIDSDDLKVKAVPSLKKKKSMPSNGNSYISDIAEVEGDFSDEDDEEHEQRERESNESVTDKESDLDDILDDDDDNQSERSDVDNERSNHIVQKKSHPIVPACCTPWRNLQRYLAYNNIGFITSRRQLDLSSATSASTSVYNYDIEFTDRSAHQPIRFSNEIAYSLASLHEKGAVFASQGVGACLHYISFENALDSWTLPLPLGSEPILVGINCSSVYLVNDRGVLNVYTLSGLLRSSSTCPGRPISLCCGDQEVYLFASDYEGVLMFKLDAMNGGLVRSSQASRVCLGDDQQLVWCGVSYSGLLGAFLSSGRFLINLTRGTDRWTEILDTSKTLSEKFEVAWPVYFDTTTLSACTCKMTDGGFPDPYPVPHVIDFTFRIPELSTDSFSNSYEEIIRSNWILNESSNTSESLSEREKKKIFATADRHLLELAQLSIKADRINRLGDLARWSSNEKTIDLLIQLARHHKLIAVVDEIETIKTQLFKPSLHSSVPIESTTTTTTTNTWSTPKLPEMVTKESPSGILANLTPVKSTSMLSSSISMSNLIPSHSVSSPAELAPSPLIPANPFAKAVSNENAEPEGNAMLDYISTMMKMNGNGQKRKIEDNASTLSKKSTAAASNPLTKSFNS